jgi:F-type H+-transporting ATPase subunit gamma
MASLREIRKRLNSVENIQQLTKAMEMVAASHLHHALVKRKQVVTYTAKLKEIVNQLALSLKDITHPLLEKKAAKKIGLIVIGSDMGLSGPYNKDIFSATRKFLKKYSLEQVELILIGRKALEHYANKEWTVRHKIPHMQGALTFLEMKQLTNELTGWFLSGQLDEIWCVYTHYINMFSRPILIEKLLSIEEPQSTEQVTTLDYILEPTPAEVYADVLQRYCTAKVQTFLYEAYASELASRVFAMKTATKNADDVIERLTLVRNKVRQAEITKEMLEITSGSEVSK